MNEKLYIVGGYDWHLAEYSDAVFLLQKKEKNVPSKNANSPLPNFNGNGNGGNLKTNNNKSNKGGTKTEFKWILQESRLLQGRSSHACVSFAGKIWIAGKFIFYFLFFFDIFYFVFL